MAHKEMAAVKRHAEAPLLAAAAADRRRAATDRELGARRVELNLPSHPDSIGEARRHVEAMAGPFVEGARMGDLQLALSEVVSNAVRHGSSAQPIELAAAPLRDRVRVQVTDRGPGFGAEPIVRSTGGGGWGLFIIQQLTSRWGFMRDSQSTRVWFEFDY